MVKNCCCCFSLQTGSLIIGWLSVLGGMGNLVLGITTMESDNFVNEANKEVLVAVGITFAVFCAILLLVSICLIVGTIKGSPELLLPWMVYIIVNLIATTVLFIVQATLYFAIQDTSAGYGNIAAAIIYFLLNLYFLLVVYSLYHEMKFPAKEVSVPPSYFTANPIVISYKNINNM